MVKTIDYGHPMKIIEIGNIWTELANKYASAVTKKIVFGV
jgi:hypothetical protein